MSVKDIFFNCNRPMLTNISQTIIQFKWLGILLQRHHCAFQTQTLKRSRHIHGILTIFVRYLVPQNMTSKVTKEIKEHDDVIKWKHFPRYWPFVRGIHRSPVNFPHKVQWRGVLMFSLICTRINGWVNSGEAGDLRRHHAHYDVTVMRWLILMTHWMCWKRPLSDWWCMMHIETICVVYDNASQDPILQRQISQNNTEIMAWIIKYFNRNMWDVIHHLWHNFSHGFS